MNIIWGLLIVLGSISLLFIIFFIYSCFIRYIRNCKTFSIAYKEYKKACKKSAEDYYNTILKGTTDIIETQYKEIFKDGTK